MRSYWSFSESRGRGRAEPGLWEPGGQGHREAWPLSARADEPSAFPWQLAPPLLGLGNPVLSRGGGVRCLTPPSLSHCSPGILAVSEQS